MDINQFQQRISRIFRSSCRSKHITDHVVESTVHPAADEQHHHHHDQLIHLFSPKNHTLFPSLCKPRWHECFQTDNNSSCIVRKISLLSDRENLLLPPHPPPPPPPPPDKGQKCPPASPITPFNNSFYDFQTPLPKSRVKKRSKRASTNRPRRSRTRSFGMNNFPACSYNGLFSSDEDDDDDDNTTFFSSRSLSSESSQSFRQGSRSSRAFKDVMIEEDGKEFESSCVMEDQSPELETKVENKSFAVMKRSNDPYNDFRTSMVEMIIEKQIFEAKDLEDLLQCFLSLNSSRHHKVIVKVFNEIWEALFFNNNNNNNNNNNKNRS